MLYFWCLLECFLPIPQDDADDCLFEPFEEVEAHERVLIICLLRKWDDPVTLRDVFGDEVISD